MMNWGHMDAVSAIPLEVIASPKGLPLAGKHDDTNLVVHLSLREQLN